MAVRSKLKYIPRFAFRSEVSLSEAEFGLAAVYRIIKKSGAERVSNEAVEELRRAVEDIAVQVAKQAVELASHAGRHTVMGSDVKLATKTVIRT